MSGMSLREVIHRHYTAFCSDVSPVELASCLHDLTMIDRDRIACLNRAYGRQDANIELCTAICSKVDWEDLYKALMKGNYRRLAKNLYEEYYKQNPGAQRIVYNEPLESQVAESDAKCKESIHEVSSSNEKASSKIDLKDKINVSNGSKDKDSTSIKSQPFAPVINNYNFHLGDINNSILQFGDQNEIKYDKPEESVEDDTTYEIETVPEVLENRSSSEIDIERSPDPQNISGRQRVELSQSIADDAYRTSNMLSTNDANLRSAACERTDSNGNQALLKTSVTSEIECSQHNEKTTSNNNIPSYFPSNFERLGIDLRHNRNSEGENRADDGDDETCLKKTMSDD